MNILVGNTNFIATEIKARVSRNKRIMAVYVQPDGRILVDRADDSKRSRDLPPEDLLGCYGSKATIRNIEEDLEFKLKEFCV